MLTAGTHETQRVVDEIAAERKRQMWDEGWTPEHDDQHSRGEMVLAAMAYTQAATQVAMPVAAMRALPAPRYWPWDAAWWKPKDRRRNLVRAAALIVAEIERLDRATVSRMAEKMPTLGTSAER